jgi:hypothetical protein
MRTGLRLSYGDGNWNRTSLPKVGDNDTVSRGERERCAGDGDGDAVAKCYLIKRSSSW